MRVPQHNSTLHANTEKPLSRSKGLSRSGRKASTLKRGKVSSNPSGYDYEAFCEGIADRDGADCWVRRNVPMDPELRLCDGKLDGHHVLPKQWLKGNVRLPYSEQTPASVLNDSRNGILVCRRHHDLLENARIALDVEALPPCVVEFAQELGERALARLQRLTNQRYEPVRERT
jgi:hypothetical protein